MGVHTYIVRRLMIDDLCLAREKVRKSFFYQEIWYKYIFIYRRTIYFIMGIALFHLFRVSTNGTGEISGLQIHYNSVHFFSIKFIEKSIFFSLSKQKDF